MPFTILDLTIKFFTQSESLSIYSKPYTPILLTFSDNIRNKNVIRLVKSLISYKRYIIIETLEH